MTVEYIKNSDNIDSYEAQLDALKEEVLEDEKHKRNIYENLNLWYNPGDISRMRDKMVNIFGIGSLERILFNNIQIQNLFSTILWEQERDWIKKNNEYDNGKAKEDRWDSNIEEQEETSPGWEEYSIRESSPENFEKFLLSEEWIAVLKQEINDHIDQNWNIYKNYPISKKILQLKLRKAWFNSLRRRYNEYYTELMDDGKINIRRYGNILSNSIDEAVWAHLKEWWDKYWNWLIKRLEELLISEDGNNILLDMKEDSIDMDNFRVFLKESIRKYANLILKRTEGKNIQLSTWETQLDLQLKSYLYIYGKFFYQDDFANGWELVNYNGTLLDIFEAILDFDGKLETVKYNKYIELERIAELSRLERDRLRRKEIAKRIKERNEYWMAQSMNKNFQPVEMQAKSVDPNQATWPEIAASAGLWEDLDGYNLNINESRKEKKQTKETAFRGAWDEFIKEHNDIAITQEQMRKLFNVNTNTFVAQWDTKRKQFIENPLFKELSPDEINKLYSRLSSFTTYFSKAEKKLSNSSSEIKTKINETVRTYAVGAVIDNVRDAFESIPKWQDSKSEWFKLDIKDPVIKIGDYIIISGSFNNSNVKIRYNLKTGELFMNSFLHKDEIDPNKISIWEISSIEHPESINHPIWKIKPFNDVLNDYYKFPPYSQTNYDTRNWPSFWDNSWMNPENNPNPSHDNLRHWNILPWSKPPHQVQVWWPTWLQPRINQSKPEYRKLETQRILSSQIDLISDAMEKHIKCQTLKNLAITNFMKSFNVISDWKYNSRDFNRESNLFSMIEIIDNTYNISDDNKYNNDYQSLEYFNNEFMPKIMEYSGLIWGQRNESQDKKGKKSERIFSYEWDNKNINLLIDKVKNFNPEQFSWANFNWSHQLEFVELIKKKVIKGTEPNRKLDIDLMKGFLESLDVENNN